MKSRRMYFAEILRNCAAAAMISLVAGCASEAPRPVPIPDKTVPAAFPDAEYRHAESLGKKVLRVDSDRSLVVIEVYRGGRLARLGHNHVVASHDVNGYVALDEGKADLYIPLDRLVVDETPLRAEAGFDTRPSREAIEGTRRNMLEKVLESERFPFALVHLDRTDNPSILNASITLHGVTQQYEVPVRIETQPDSIIVSGNLSFNQSDFGIVPFSVLGGALQVQDRLALRFRIFAERK